MHCPSCGVAVIEQAVFCHKCGKRLDLESQRAQGLAGNESKTASDETPPTVPHGVDGLTNGEPNVDVTGTFRDGVAARQGADAEPEHDLWQGGYCSKAMIGAWVISGLVTLVLLILGIYFMNRWLWIAIVAVLLGLWAYQGLTLFYRRLNVRYTLTTQRFMHESGILRRVTDRIELIDMDDITVDQKVLERLLGVGTITITSSDTTHPNLIMPGIENVKQVAGIIDDTRRQERRRRGLHIEAV